MPRGVWKDPGKRSAAARKGAAHRKAKPRGPYAFKVLPEEVAVRMRVIADHVKSATPLPADRLASPGEVASRIDGFLAALDRSGGG